VQGLVSCQKCGYAFSRTSTYTSARKIHYYKCIGSDGWRKLGGPVCDNKRFVRQDLLDEVVWTEVVRLLEDPTLIQQELDRRLVAARSADPTKKRESVLQRELTRVGKSIERVLTAYQEDLLSLEQLRERMPSLRQREQTLRAELRAIADQTNDRAKFLRLAETLGAFLARLRSAATTLDVIERQRIVRLVVKEVLIGDDSIVIRHSIPGAPASPPSGGLSGSDCGREVPIGGNYLMRSGSGDTPLRGATIPRDSFSVDVHRRLQPSFDVQQDPCHIAVLLDRSHQQPVIDVVEQSLDIELDNPVIIPASSSHQRYRIQSRAPWAIAKGVTIKRRLEPWLEDHLDHSLCDSIGNGWHA
jgi:site-specific DNA recombinase